MAYQEKKIPAICACGCCLPFMAIIREIERGRGKYMNHSHSATAQNLEGRAGIKCGPKKAPKKPLVFNSFLSPKANRKSIN